MTNPATEKPRPPQVRTPDGFVRRRNGLAVARITQPARPCAGMSRISREARPPERFRSWSAALLRRFSPTSTLQPFNPSTLQPRAGFTLLELLIVVGIIALLMVLIAPAFTTSKAEPTSPAPHTRSKACSTPPAHTRRQTTLTPGSGSLRKMSPLSRSPSDSWQSEELSCRSSLQRTER